MEKKLLTAQISLTAGKPVSTKYDDCYFASDNGIPESQYNFIDGNRLSQRFSEATPTLFTIAETGFGTGLNFLLTAQLWQQQVPKQRKLHYIAVEKHPIDATMLNDIYDQQQWHNDFSKQLIDNYPPLNIGAHHIALSNNIQLTLLFGDAKQQLSTFEFVADAWFLDGFTPSKNPDMWTLPLFKIIAQRSKSQTTFATFTAASVVRKNLIEAGFIVKKTSGFELKRERLIGYFQ